MDGKAGHDLYRPRPGNHTVGHQLHPHPFPGSGRQARGGCGRVPEPPWLYPARRARLRFPQCLAYDRRLGRGQSRRHLGAYRVLGAGVMGEIMFERIALIGIGLIGSSIARDIRELGLARHVTISTRSEETLKRAEELELGTDYTVSAAEAVKDADLVIVSVPVGASESVAQQIAPHLKPGAIITDVGSTKASVIAQMAPHMPDNVHFIPGHPLAGTEKSGPDAGFAGLFRERWCIFTPLPGTDAEALEKLKDFWRALGSRVDEMDAEHHDKVLAIVSHLPHIIAYNIVGTADDLETVTESEVIKYSASGFRDFTRLAASDPTMWRDVCLHNKDAILEMLARFSEDLASLQRAIRWGEGDKLFELFSRTRAIRRSIVQAGQDVDAPDFGRHALDQKK
ncbi:prephenate/arogenate dehydrogenase family protein [Rhizobium sp.]|uniref:prephenate/arogenate dehydrogenase family protein n=1 Tax=Rhizobium sp. TaxID=391 RepID=UPI0028AA25B8